MGDMCDFINDSMYGWGGDNEPHGDYVYRKYPLPRCRDCKQDGLYWKQHDSGKWWLVDKDGNWHTCTVNREV